MGKPTTSSTGTSNQLQNFTSSYNPAPFYTQQFQDILNAGNTLFGGASQLSPGLTPDQIQASLLMNAGVENYMMQPSVPAYDVFGMGNQWDRGPFPVTTAPIMGGNLNFSPASAAQAQAAQAQAAQLGPSEIAPFMNPYINTALDPALNRLRQQQAEVQSGINAQAAAANMFGGSRQAVQNMLADRNYRDTLANTAGNMLSQGYNTALGAAQGNVANRQQTALANAQMQNAINQLNAQLATSTSVANMQGMNQFGLGLAGLQQNAALQNAQMQNAAAQQYQNLQFQGAQSDASRFLQAVGLQPQIESNQMSTIINAANALNQLGGTQQQTMAGALGQYWQQLNNLANLLRAGNPPYNQAGTTSTVGTTTGTQTRPFDFGSAAIGLLGLLGRSNVFGGLSDREDKTDIQKLGADPMTGVDQYAYRYKGDPKSYPKVVGPMADDMEKAFPGITSLIGGHQVINAV